MYTELNVGFVEGGGAIAIEAAHAARNTSVDGLSWLELPGYGRTLSAVTPWPRGGADRNFSAGAGPHLYVSLHAAQTRQLSSISGCMNQ